MEYLFIIILTAASFALGLVGSIAGVGGGVLFTPIFLAFTQMNVDVIRAAGLAVALTTAVISSRNYIRAGITPLKLALLFGAVASLTAIVGAALGIYIVKQFGKVGEAYVRIALASVMLLVVVAMFLKRQDYPEPRPNKISEKLGLAGFYNDPVRGRVAYVPNRIFLSALLMSGVGFIGGMFGLGGGWAIVPILNLVSRLPLKVAVATSLTIIAITDAPALMVYNINGALNAYIVALTAPMVALGALVGSKIMIKIKASVIRYAIIAVMIISAIQLIQRGLAQLS
ncbi:sulfite exporter TauE/SafE family protein [Pyrobaculum aerophilum]|nr:sulfite exporter TauE/SafE family protein [Pyrobaculum aerophilum]